MALTDLIPQPVTISDEDRVAQTVTLIERSFDTEIGNLGAVEMRDGKPTLIFSHEGAEHTLTWERQASGAIFWWLDGDTKIILGGPDRAAKVLLQAVTERMRAVPRSRA